MKTTKLNTLKKTMLSGGLVILIIFSLHSCAKKSLFLTSSVVPAAQGNVTVKQDKNNNYVINAN